MCGISGVATFKEAGAPESVTEKINRALRHRGPDDEGYFRDQGEKAILGHTRLSIIDLGSGHQPIFNEDGRIAVVFNGEIYNYLELRKELEHKGHTFSTQSDTEVIVHLYEEMGHDCVHRLRGMFAFAIWDGHKDELYLARDRVGKKPLYYAIANETLYFASEIQALYDIPEIPKEIDYGAIDHYLTYSYIPSPYSIYKAIRKLPPAHRLVYHANGMEIVRYWAPDYRPKTSLDYEGAKRELIRILSEAVRMRLLSDVPLGAFLSGGVDSSTVVALMSRLSNRPVKTFAIGFPDKDFNELSYAKEVARLYQTDHHEFMVEPNRLEVLPDIVRHYGEPYGDSSAIPTWYLSRITRGHVTVALNGDGGDELFGGYAWYRVIHHLNRASNLVGRPLSVVLRHLGRQLLPRRIQRGLELLALPAPQRFQALRSFIGTHDREDLYHENFRQQLEIAAEEYLCRLYDGSLEHDYDRLFCADFLSYLPEDLLVKVDRASMAHGLECRSPFLDQELVEFSCSLPPDWKISGGRSKRILKEAMADWFPKGFLDRPKMGFSVPIGKWFRGELRSFIYDRLMDGQLASMPLLRKQSIRAILQEHFEGVRDHETRIWNLFMLSLWFDEYGKPI
ncbi:MAG: asparagine synthase (glutamine-hydrolyzing) [Nitrospira sp.]|nr:asparagine synthase (glutamine-hydrolyzing) [Nitrospira sp.]